MSTVAGGLVCASARLPGSYRVMPYRGYFHLHAANGSLVDHDFDVAVRKLIMCHNVGSGVDFGYFHQFDVDKYGIDFTTKFAGESRALLVTAAMGFGNGFAEKINDAIIDPNRASRESNLYQEHNCQLQEILYKGWPYPFIIVSSSIKPGDELLMSYGACVYLILLA